MIFHDIDDQDAFTESEATSLRFRCAHLLTMVANDYLAMGAYSESIHESLDTSLRRWGLRGIPRSQSELNIVLQATLITHASCDKVIWACDHWSQKDCDHTLPEKLGYTARIFVAVACLRRVLAVSNPRYAD